MILGQQVCFRAFCKLLELNPKRALGLQMCFEGTASKLSFAALWHVSFNEVKRLLPGIQSGLAPPDLRKLQGNTQDRECAMTQPLFC